MECVEYRDETIEQTNKWMTWKKTACKQLHLNLLLKYSTSSDLCLQPEFPSILRRLNIYIRLIDYTIHCFSLATRRAIFIVFLLGSLFVSLNNDVIRSIPCCRGDKWAIRNEFQV